MFALSSGSQFFSGGAGDNWLTDSREGAFTYATREGAERKAYFLNKATALHGSTFTVVSVNPPIMVGDFEQMREDWLRATI